jgi:hypothetical protein
VQAREDVPGHRLAFECGDGLLNALLADGCGVLGDQAWYSPFFRPSTSFGLASTPTRSTCTTLPALHDLAGVAPGRRSSRRRGLRVGVAGLEPGDALAEAQHCDAVGHRHHLGHVVLISTTAMPLSTLLITSSTR